MNLGRRDLRALPAPVRVRTLEYAKSAGGRWSPCAGHEAVPADFKGQDRAVAPVAIEPNGSMAGCGS